MDTNRGLDAQLKSRNPLDISVKITESDFRSRVRYSLGRNEVIRCDL